MSANDLVNHFDAPREVLSRYCHITRQDNGRQASRLSVFVDQARRLTSTLFTIEIHIAGYDDRSIRINLSLKMGIPEGEKSMASS